MEIDGTYTLQAPAEEVWRCLMEQQTIQRSIPGLERLTQVDERTYSFTLQMRYAPLRGSYTGRITILEPQYSTSCHLKVEGEGQSNQFRGECDLQLITQNANTVISYRGTIQLGRGSNPISAPLIRGAVKVLLQQFFTALADQLRSEREGPVYVTTLEEIYEMPFMEEQLSEHLMLAKSSPPGNLLHRAVRFLGLGQHDPLREEQWVQRIRQVGIVVVLLLLVWVGTRLPRRIAQATHS